MFYFTAIEPQQKTKFNVRSLYSLQVSINDKLSQLSEGLNFETANYISEPMNLFAFNAQF